ncbi:hypothetical protein V502_05303 [Pseudogymnoascus sp. VKM F-4520 (FW-2644)]|nr:hypothetical protein V502_05303 [Pseudogymnoascus sp. VKM F-4520 (FW-2644)]
MATQDLTINLVPVLPSDYPALARLESAVFGETDVGAVGFGPDRNTDAAMDQRAVSLSAAPKLGETVRNMKLVRTGPAGVQEIVGYASWVICVGRTGSEEEKTRLGTREAWAAQEDPGPEPFGPGADVRFCEDVFVRADEHMARATGGKDYAKLRMLAVLPECQRMGLGAMMLEEGLREADRRGLQSILGASPYGIGLYRRHGLDTEAGAGAIPASALRIRSSFWPELEEILREKAREVWRQLPYYSNKPEPEFSTRWLEKFKKRHSIRARFQHGEAGSTPDVEEAMEKLRLIAKQYKEEDIYNMDETGLF